MSDTSSIIYFVPSGSAEARFTERGSKFLGWAAKADSEEEAVALVAGRARRHHDATHHCWAFRIGSPFDPLERSSDAGEPSGTAGRPILEQIRKAGLLNCVVVVTRWFGGIKLGKGGLMRAYSESAAQVIAALPSRSNRAMVEMTVACPYELIGLVGRLAEVCGGSIKAGTYTEQVYLVILMPITEESSFRQMISEDGGGKVTVLNKE